MKYEIIKTENYLFVVDESEIKEGDWCTSHLNVIDEGKFHNSYTLFNPQNQEHLDMFKNCKKIIAHLPLNFSPILAGVDLLPPIEQENDEKSLFANEIENMLEYDRGRWYGRIEGYIKAKEKYKYTEEDLRKAFLKGVSVTGEGYNAEYAQGNSPDIECEFGEDADKFIQSLSQPKMPIGFECETDYDCCYRYMNCKGCDATAEMINLRPKTTTTSEGHTQWVGTYIY